MLQAELSNLMLQSFAPGDFALLKPHLQLVHLTSGQVLTAAKSQIEAMYFPLGGVVSIDDIFDDGTRVGIGIIGFEGVIGWPLLLGDDAASHEAVVAIGGATALRIAKAPLLDACARSSSVQALLLRFVQAFMSQLARTTVSNLIGSVERRLARWLLMNQDRLRSEHINLTHKQLGVMLGMRRASVTDALHLLEGEKLVRNSRGSVVILDRAGLRRTAGTCYGFAEAEYTRLIGPFCSDCSLNQQDAAQSRSSEARASHPIARSAPASRPEPR